MIPLLMLAATTALQPGTHAGRETHGARAGAHSAPLETRTPSEVGQSAFAALAEVVAILTGDPTTEWSKVNIDALRAHLVDMDNVTLRARVTSERVPNGARFMVTGSQDVVGSIQRMTGSHFESGELASGWTGRATMIGKGAIVTVTSSRPADAQRIHALGLFGILSMGSHHQPHHLMIARGMQH